MQCHFRSLSPSFSASPAGKWNCLHEPYQTNLCLLFSPSPCKQFWKVRVQLGFNNLHGILCCCMGGRAGRAGGSPGCWEGNSWPYKIPIEKSWKAGGHGANVASRKKETYLLSTICIPGIMVFYWIIHLILQLFYEIIDIIIFNFLDKTENGDMNNLAQKLKRRLGSKDLTWSFYNSTTFLCLSGSKSNLPQRFAPCIEAAMWFIETLWSLLLLMQSFLFSILG